MLPHLLSLNLNIFVNDPFFSQNIDIRRNPCDECGIGSTCEIKEGKALCKCPVGTVGNSKERCCSQVMKCQCWGDPHCATFDKAYFSFMSKCKYDMVSTYCYGKKLVSPSVYEWDNLIYLLDFCLLDLYGY